MNNSIDEYESLLIRACKANLSDDEFIRRCKRIWGIRCMSETDYIDSYEICFRLVSIIEKLNIKTLSEFFNEFHSSPYRFDENFVKQNSTYQSITIAKSIIRLTKSDVFKGMRHAAKWRNN